MSKYFVFIDESGESGIKTVRTQSSGGASPYMTIGGFIVKHSARKTVEQHLQEISNTLGKNRLHCNKLKHNQKVYFAREIAKSPIVCFGVISLKATLGTYKEIISSDNIKYFNKCAQYFLERVSFFMDNHNIKGDDLNIIFEQGHHDYAKFRSFIKKCQENPLHPATALLKTINIANISEAKKEDEPLLDIADLIAHALFKAVDKTIINFAIPETKYLLEIHKKFYSNPRTSKVINYGIKPIHSLDDLNLDDDVFALINSFTTK